ncbi:hypothetical protein KTT_26140 [Tengunoibacter tsumagoiensis]|uniref:Branched-chain amino acid ABC transporter permease n=1 Tax=Tengunoibacter tsumagoiensis TaxID=2014871 RepID=A0A402A0Z9_9CHLR|nr:hypothetical protein KTT_26140 [Tengunoibacter tsumagoiensis]
MLVKWIVALLVPLVVFTFVWAGEGIINNALLGLLFGVKTEYESTTLIFAAIFTIVFYATMLGLVGYMVAADSGQRSMYSLWLDIAIFVLVPLLLIITNGLVLGLSLSVIAWVIYFLIRNRILKSRSEVVSPLPSVSALDEMQRLSLVHRARLAGFWFAVIFAVIALVADIIFLLTGDLPADLLIWVVARTLVLPVAGYLLGQLGGRFALRFALSPKDEESGVKKEQQLEVLSRTRVREEAKDLVPNALPLRSTGAQRFYVLLLTAFLLFYPFIDRFLFGVGTEGRLASYGDAGYYVILALGLNIVVGFAGLLDLGYVAFFAIGAYLWGLVGSIQFQVLTGIHMDLTLTSWLFWPLLIVAALITALFGVLLGAPTLRLKGDYLAIVTLGFGEIVPVVLLELDKYTNGTNGLIGIRKPAFPGADWTTSLPFYYLILALIVLVVFANIRLRDSRLGRAWVAIREDEIAASSSGINLVNTKLFAFAAGAFFSGIAGVYHAAKLGSISPDMFSFGDSVIYLAMVVIGGIGSIPGVIVGALVVYALNQFVIAQLDTFATDPTSFINPIYTFIVKYVPGFTFGNIRNLLFGIILVLVMIFRPEGFIPSARRRRELHKVDAATEEVPIDALDANPGTSEFESSVQVE